MSTLLEFKGRRPKVAEGVFLAHNATLIGDVEIAIGASVWFGAVLLGPPSVQRVMVNVPYVPSAWSENRVEVIR